MDQTTLNIAVVGAGGMGTVHLSNYARLAGCRVTAVCDPTDAGEEKALEFGAKPYGNLAALLEAESVDVVDICTPTFLHMEQALQAMAAGKHVICEKPVALRRADAKRMFDAARANGVRMFVAQVVQYAPQTRVLRELVTGGVYGKVLDAQFSRLSGCPRWVKNGWLFDRARSGLLPFDLHIHDLDLIVSLFGMPKTVDYTSCGREGIAYREHYRFRYGYADKSVAAEAAWYHADFPFTATWRVYFENAVVVNEGGRVTAYRPECLPRVFDTAEKMQIPTGINLPPTGMFYEELGDFLAMIRGEERGGDREDEILAVLEILETIE